MTRWCVGVTVTALKVLKVYLHKKKTTNENGRKAYK